jgi:cytidylate kinase
MHELKWSHQQHPRDVGAMVDAQVRRWVWKQKGRQDQPGEWPVVTIAGEFEAQGTTFGRGIADRLGYSYFDRGIVSELVRLTYVSHGTAGEFATKTRNVLEDLLGAFAPELDASAAGFTERIRQVVRSIARQGSAVIVGNEASFLVDPRRALRVRLVAPFDVRIGEIETRTHVSLAVAKQTIASQERECAAFVRHALGQNIADPAHYDVVVNTGTYAQERAEAVVLMAYLAKFGKWPLTAHALKGELPDGAVQRPVIDLQTDRAH